MNAAVLHAFAQPPRFEAFAEPTPGPEEVLVHVAAAGLHPIVRALGSGRHYGSAGPLPRVLGVDGVGRLDDGQRVYFGFVAPPFGTMAERAVVSRHSHVPAPDGVDDATLAAIVNPGLSAWLALEARAQLAPGETVLVLGATGAAGQLAIQIARVLGAGRVIAAGRNPAVLAGLPGLGADAVVSLDQPADALRAALVNAAGDAGIHVIVDFIWGAPTEAAIAAIARTGLTHAAPRVRLVQVGEGAGPTITLPASVLRSSGLEILGSGAGSTPLAKIVEVMPRFLAQVARGALRIDVERVPLRAVTSAWVRASAGRRLVLAP